MEIQASTSQTGTTIKSQFFQTNLATVALLAASILPNSVYLFPVEDQLPNIEHMKFVGNEYSFASEVNQKDPYTQILETFASNIIENSVETEPDIALITKKRFLDMYEDF